MEQQAVRAREQQARLQEQKQQQATERKSLVAKYPDGKMPPSYPDISEKEIYFFVYRSLEPVPYVPPVASTSASGPPPAYKTGQYYLIEAFQPAMKYYVLFTKRANDILLGPFRVVDDAAKKWQKWGGFTHVKILKEVTEQEAKGTIEGDLASSSVGSQVPTYKTGQYYLIEAYKSRLKYYVLFTKNSYGTLLGEFRAVGEPAKTWHDLGGFTDVKILKEVTEQEAKESNEETMLSNNPVAPIILDKTPEQTSQSGLPELYVSNVFSVSRFTDGTWPLKSRVIEKLNLSGGTTGIILSGYYNSLSDAESSQRYLLAKAQECAYVVKNLVCSNTEGVKTTAPVTGSWSKLPGTSTSTVPVKEPVSTKPKLDFWDNPVKD